MPDFKKDAITTKLWLRSFFATCYPTREGEQGILKIADTRYFAMRGEPTAKYSGWRCPRRHAITLMEPRKKVAGFQSKMTVFQRKTVIFLIFQTIFIEAPVCRPVLNFIKFLGFLSL